MDDATLIDAIPDALLEYYQTDKYKTQRFGQFYINQYMPSNTVWPELFYERDIFKAQQMIINRIYGGQPK